MAARLDDVDGASRTSRAVLRNIRAMERAVSALIKPMWAHDDVHAVHGLLLPRPSTRAAIGKSRSTSVALPH